MLRVILADDHRIFREALRELLEQQGGFDVVGETSNGAEVVGMVTVQTPDLVLMDLNMPALNGIEATRQITETVPSTKVICLSMHGEERFVRAMFDAGACAYLLKACAIGELMDATRKAVAGERYISRSICVNADELVFSKSDDVVNSAFGVLTSRERQITQLYAEGLTSKEIARALKISEKTVGTHRGHVMKKLNLNGIADITKYAVRQGLTDL